MGCLSTKQISEFSGRRRTRRTITTTKSSTSKNTNCKKNINESSVSKTDSLNEEYVTLTCFENGEFVAGFGFIAEIRRHSNGKLSYSGWNSNVYEEKPQLLWTNQYLNIPAVLYTVDSSDIHKIKFSKKELHTFFAEENFKEFYLLIFCNEDRMINSMDAGEIEQKLKLKDLKNCTDYRVQPTIGNKGCGFQCGLVWLFDILEKRYNPPSEPNIHFA